MSTSAPIRPSENAKSDALRRREAARRSRIAGGVRENREEPVADRQRRIDRIEAGKSRIWRINLRVSELVTFLVFAPSVLFLWWQSWAYWALVPACAMSVGGMWAFAQRMRPYESRLCRHMMFLARHRRRCAMCRYCIQGLSGPHCPECAFEFDPNDDSHLLIPLVNQMYSRQGRQVASVAIVAVMIAVVLMANDALIRWYFVWSGGLLAILHVFVLVIVRRVRQSSYESLYSPTLTLRLDTGGRKKVCRVLYLAFLVRWAMLSALCAGLCALMNANTTWIERLFPTRSPLGLYCSIGAVILAWSAVIAISYRKATASLNNRLRVVLHESRRPEHHTA